MTGLKGIKKATHLAAIGFGFISMGQYAWCESRRKNEAKGIALAVIGMKKLQEKKQREKEADEARAAAIAAAAEAERLREDQRQKQKNSWTFW